MRKLLFIIVLLPLSLALTSCDQDVIKGRSVYEAYYRHVLKDPDSFKIYKESYSKEGTSTINWVIDYGAKNGLGGMVRETVEFETIGTTIFINGTSYDLEDLK